MSLKLMDPLGHIRVTIVAVILVIGSNTFTFYSEKEDIIPIITCNFNA